MPRTPALSTQYPAPRHRSRRAVNSTAVADAAVRAAKVPGVSPDDRHVVFWRFVGWFFGRILALTLLIGSAWVVYDFASSEQFHIRSVRVTGNVLVSQAEVEHLAGVKGANLFWIDRREVENRLRRALPPVRRAEVTPILPDVVEIHLTERTPAAFWSSGGQTYLVDREGIVLASVTDRADLPRACADQPCDPRLAPSFPVVAQIDGPSLAAGAQVDFSALDKSAHLASLLPQAGVQPLAFEWTRDNGLEVPTQQGWRVRFGGSEDVQWQITALKAIQDHLTKTKRSAEVIDVRFHDRPYFR